MGLEVYADADYAVKASNRRSMQEISVTLGGTVVSHASKAQHVVSLSTSKTEYNAAGEKLNPGLMEDIKGAEMPAIIRKSALVYHEAVRKFNTGGIWQALLSRICEERDKLQFSTTLCTTTNTCWRVYL